MNRLITTLVCILMQTALFAQDLTFSGKVVDSETQEPLSNVHIRVLETNTLVLSNEDGTFELSLVDGYETLKIHFDGYKTQTLFVAGLSQMNISLEKYADQTGLITVGFGKQSKEELSSSISQINTDEVTPAPLVSLEQGSQGMATGLMVQNSSGKLGGPTTVRVRGGSTLSNSNSPLYVIDGVPLASGNQSNLNPNNIASMEILKDASAAAIYGSRAANGVVIITTKSGQDGKMKLDFDYQVGVSQTPKYLDLYSADEYNQQLIEFAVRRNTPFSELITREQLVAWQQAGSNRIDFSPTDFIVLELLNENTDWQKEVFRTGLSHRANIGVRGGNETFKYFVSGSYNTQEGILIGNKYNRLNGTVSLDATISPKFSVSYDLNYIYAKEFRINEELDEGSPLQAILLPAADGFDPNNNFNLLQRQQDYNPLTEVNFSDNFGFNNSIISNLGMEFKASDQFSINVTGGVDYSDLRDERRQGPETREGFGTGLSQLGTNLLKNYVFNGYLNYAPDLGEDHKLSLVVGGSYQKSEVESTFRRARLNSVSELDALVEGDPSLTELDIPNGGSVFVSSFWRINYGVHDRFNFQVSGRVDGSSKFGPENRYGFFPAVSASWLLSDEPTIAHLHFMDHFKLKASFGLIGNTPLDDFLYTSNYFTTRYGEDNDLGFVLLNLANPELKWETTSQFNIGFELEFLSRIRGSFDYYVKRTKDLLFPVPVSQTSGFSSVLRNIGSMENIGLEITLGATNVETPNFSWSTDFNISFNDNLVTDLGGNQLIVGPSAFLEGQPAGVFYLRKYAGVDSETGEALYDNGFGGTTTNWEGAARQIVGNPNPEYFGGLTNTLKYKNFDLSFLVQFVGGVDLYNQTGEFLSNSGILNLSQSASQVDRWYSPGDQALYPVLDPFEDNLNASTRWLQSGDYIRLKNITVTYNLPTDVVSGWGLDYMKVYVGGQNLLTFTDYTGYDPDVNYTDPLNGTIGQNISRGIDNFTAPQPRIIMAGLKIGF